MQNSPKKNNSKVLYDQEVIELISKNHESLSEDITEVYDKISSLALMQHEVVILIKNKFTNYANLAGKLSVYLFELNEKQKSEDLDAEDQKIIEKMRELTRKAALVQNIFNNEILNIISQIQADTDEMIKSNDKLINLVMDVQSESRILNYLFKSNYDPDSQIYSNLLNKSVEFAKENNF